MFSLRELQKSKDETSRLPPIKCTGEACNGDRVTIPFPLGARSCWGLDPADFAANLSSRVATNPSGHSRAPLL